MGCSESTKYVFSINEEQNILIKNLKEHERAYSILPYYNSKRYLEIESIIKNFKFDNYIILIESNANVSDYSIIYYGLDKDKTTVYSWDLIENVFEYKEYPEFIFKTTFKDFIYFSESPMRLDGTTHYMIIVLGDRIFRNCFYSVAFFNINKTDYIERLICLFYNLEKLQEKE